MGKLSAETPRANSLDDADDETAFRVASESDTSSLASLLDNDPGDTQLASRIHAFETVGVPLDPRQWPSWKKAFVAFAIAFYT